MADGKPSAQTDGTKRKVLDSTKRAILNELAQGAKNCELVKKYGVSKSTISTILKNKDKIISAYANSTDRKRLRRATYTDDHSGGDLWQRVVDSDMGGRDICWDDFVLADDDADTAEPCTDEGIVNEVRGKNDSEESDNDDDETLEPAPTSVFLAIGYIDSLRQLVYAKGLGEEHAATLNKLETHPYRIGTLKADVHHGLFLLIDRTGDPKWNPASLEEVTDEKVNSYFEPLPSDKELRL
ncbi:hypothetical protein HPB52_006040 [Rhipicephalus sanguineus]|uniref:3-hydroxyisobutyryl-CoA hydrolase n=1 Tax=Rhipicephalus sanguineus TaxID=34632 RepID=A0A9D4SVS3_RHISA|nr:hypothetical protein HPB52_006040 [Rhipicephalus sanguineus]